MRIPVKRLLQLLLAGSLTATYVLPITRAQAQAPAGWTFGVGGIAMHWGDDEAPFDALGGPAVQVSRLTPGGAGFDVRAAYLLPSGFYNLTGVSGILGVNYGRPAGRTLLLLKAGVTGLLGGDSDGSIYGGGGGYAGAGAVLPVAGRLGLHLEALGRYLETGDGGIFAPGVALGVLLLPAHR